MSSILVEGLTVKNSAVIGGCGSRGIAGHPLIRQFNPWLLLSTGHSGEVDDLHGSSATISVCARMGSQVSSTSQTATLARNVSKWFLATATTLLDLPLRAHPARSVTNAKGNNAVYLLLHLMPFYLVLGLWIPKIQSTKTPLCISGGKLDPK